MCSRMRICRVGGGGGGVQLHTTLREWMYPLARLMASQQWFFPLCSHFDAVTCVVFHPTDYVLVTGSEDCTLKVWNFEKVAQAKK